MDYDRLKYFETLLGKKASYAKTKLLEKDLKEGQYRKRIRWRRDLS
jgi:hypothetical protein